MLGGRLAEAVRSPPGSPRVAYAGRMARDLEGRTAIVTGAGRGIGEAIALELARLGARLVINDIGRDDAGRPTAETVAAQICSDGGEAVANLDSIVDYAASARIVENALDTFGRVDSLVTAAAGVAPCQERLGAAPRKREVAAKGG